MKTLKKFQYIEKPEFCSFFLCLIFLNAKMRGIKRPFFTKYLNFALENSFMLKNYFVINPVGILNFKFKDPFFLKETKKDPAYISGEREQEISVFRHSPFLTSFAVTKNNKIIFSPLETSQKFKCINKRIFLTKT